MAYVFGWLVGAGLPPTATYIVLAVITVDPMRKLGIDPWVAHFCVFLLAVWGELSPPTSLAAAVSARIAEASFVRTMYQALKLCLPVTLMTFAIFTRLDLRKVQWLLGFDVARRYADLERFGRQAGEDAEADWAGGCLRASTHRIEDFPARANRFTEGPASPSV